MTKPILLIVEDDQAAAQLYEEIFGHHGWYVVLARDGDEAVQMALQYIPKAILLDLMLPKKGGLHVLKILKTLPETRTVPVVVVTAYPNQEYQEEAVAAGCDGYILKPDLPNTDLPAKLIAILEEKGLKDW